MDYCIKAWAVYGRDGIDHRHRQRESFHKSFTFDRSHDQYVRTVTCLNSDVTGTNDYSLVIIARNTPEECDAEFDGQLSDGIFEDSAVGMIVPFNELSNEYNEYKEV